MDTDQGEERAPERPSEEKFEVAVDYDEEDEKEEYIPLQGPFEFDSKEESLAAFDEMIRAAFGRMEYNDIKRKVWKSVEKLMMHTNTSADSKTVLTVSMQATDLSGRLSTGRQIFSLALGQGKLPDWMESEMKQLTEILPELKGPELKVLIVLQIIKKTHTSIKIYLYINF